jgi:hypothetical protein
VPNEAVDVSLGDQPLTTITADVEGRILRATISIPSLSAGDYTVLFVGQTSRTPVAVGLNIQGFRPWVVLHNYYVSPQSGGGIQWRRLRSRGSGSGVSELDLECAGGAGDRRQ